MNTGFQCAMYQKIIKLDAQLNTLYVFLACFERMEFLIVLKREFVMVDGEELNYVRKIHQGLDDM